MIPKSHSVHPPPFLQGTWASNQIFKKGAGLDRTATFRGGCWEREGWLFSRGAGLDILLIYKGGGLGKKEEGGVFEGGWYPNAHYESGAKLEEKLIFVSKMTRIWWILIWALKIALWLVPFVQSIQRLT